jgi:hypothetical protein
VTYSKSHRAGYRTLYLLAIFFPTLHAASFNGGGLKIIFAQFPIITIQINIPSLKNLMVSLKSSREVYDYQYSSLTHTR